MATILNLETSTSVCSVSLSKDGMVEFHKENYLNMSHATSLGVFVEEALEFAKKNNHKLDAISVSCGPGSYTGLRIAKKIINTFFTKTFKHH